ncbi:unnamed protein product [Triticum turgidum subsp. durum]|uniref:DUF4220 domain-containing protein n=1 Tax=Triticum turgidum subsp. durum TaxID=4567 RepID=A0A9R1RGW9_TRITD|nr:unnamed protein product [Triticum turgidum subsp. durum]
MLAAILIFGLGVAKYGERTCALWFANFSRLRSSLKVLPRDKHHQKFYTEHQHGYDNSNAELLQLAHSLFHICKRGIVDSVMMVDPDSLSELDSLDNTTIQGLMKDRERMWTVMEMELSLMYDILYTKLSGKDGDSQADVVVTYTLLVVALVLETKSLVGALGSSWVFAFLCATRCNWLRHAALCSGRWHWLRQRLGSLRRSWPGKAIITRNSRRWSGTMGQHNMLQFRTGEMDSTGHQLGSLFKMVGLSESFERRYYSWTVEVPEKVKERAQKVDDIVSTGDINTMGMLRYNWGKMALSEKKYPGLYMELEDWHGVDFHESIISWHIATDLILAAGQPSGHDAADGRVEAVRALSNYMMFLLVDRPDMLPGLPQNWLYKKTCTNLDDLCKERLVGSRGNIFTALKRLFGPRHHRRCLNPSKLEKELAGIILELPHEENFNYYETPRLMYARKIARILRRRDEDAVVVLLDVWTDFMAYAANRCSREAHARNLNSGGELTTVLWLMIEHLRLIKGDATKVNARV